MTIKSKNKILSKINSIFVMIILFLTIFSVGTYFVNIYFEEKLSYLGYVIIFILAIVMLVVVLLSMTLITLISIKKHITKILKFPYEIKEIKISGDKNLIKVFKNNVYFCTLRIENLNAEYITLIIPLYTPLSFFNASSRRIVGDGNEIIRTKLPKAIWDIHTEFDTDKNYLIVKIDAELLKEKDDILPIIEEIKEKIEKMEYSDEHLKKLPDEMVATNEFMKGHMCTKCGNLIPKSKINEKCPVDGDPHKTTMLMLDIHVPYSPVQRISPVFVIAIIILFAIEIKVFGHYLSDTATMIFLLSEGIFFMYLIKYYFQNILNFKNMLRHFGAKKEYILKNLGKEEGNNLTSKVEAPKERKP